MDVLEKVEKLPEDVKEFFHSNEVRLLMERACFLYDINEDDIEKITMAIAGIFLHEVELKNLPIIIGRELKVDGPAAYGIAYELNAKIFSQFETYFLGASMLLNQWNASKIAPIISEEKAHLRILDIEPWILEQEKEEKEQQKKEAEEAAKKQAKIEKLSLEQALEKYPALGEQAITSNPIKLRYFPTPVKPSIKNWITDYHEALGAGKHSTMDRGNFLFHGENGKRLTQMERQKVSLMLKSLDEEMLLSIDGDAQKIIFEIASQSPAAPSSENVQQAPQPAVSVQPRATVQAAPSRENPPEDIAQARIRQSLNFAKVEPAQFAKNENKAKIFDFEDSNYANTLREKISEQEKPVMGAFSFSSAQELPVEKQAAAPIQKPVQNFDMPVQQTRVEPVRTAPTWNSPDFKKQISQEKPQEKTQEMPREMAKEALQVEKLPVDVFAKNQPSQPQRVYSPYLIGPSKSYIGGQGGAVAPGQADPKVKGNMVDLS